MEITQIEWVSKEEAGVLLGTIGRPLSSRRVLELAKEGRIESGRSRDPNNGQTVVRIHAGSIERYLEKKKNPEPVPHPKEREVREPQTSQGRRGTGELAELVRVVREGCAAAGPARLWLTLQEAVDYSGLPAAVLVQFIAIGRLPALDVGKGRRGGRWRIRRIDLRQLDARPLSLPQIREQNA
jgi:hypothetical protein